MSLPGVESARRRRASHPSSTDSSFSTFSFRLNQRLNTHHYTPTQRVRSCNALASSVGSNAQVDDDDDDDDDGMMITMHESDELIANNQRRVAAIEARDRLHDKLWRLNVGGIRGSAHRWRHRRLQQVASMTVFANSCSTFQFLTSLLLKSKSRFPIPMTRQPVPEPNIEHTDEESSCPVCLDTLMLSLGSDDNHCNSIKHQVVISLPCRHSFHRDCLLPWVSLVASAKSCPVCRAPITLA